MVCAECRLFPGEPTCGACRAASRAIGILRSGQLRAEQEGLVSGILRIAVAELSDLVEENQRTEGAAGATENKEEAKGLTSGPLPGTPAKEVPKADKEDSEYTYESEEEEVTEEDRQEATPARASEGKGEPGDSATAGAEADPGTEVNKDRGEAYKEKVRGKFDPEYFTKRLCLTPAPKPRSGRSRDKRKRASPERQRGGEELEAAEHQVARASPGERGRSPGAHHGDEDSDKREPLPRRPQREKRPKNRGSRGAKKRDRAREFRAKKIEERKAKKAARDQECHRKPKPKQW